MNNTTILSQFFSKISTDPRINTSHVSIYLLLSQYWMQNQFQNPIHITRADIMKKTRISSKATYHKCIKELNSSGYISYNPSYHPVLGSKVYILDLKNDVTTNSYA